MVTIKRSAAKGSTSATHLTYNIDGEPTRAVTISTPFVLASSILRRRISLPLLPLCFIPLNEKKVDAPCVVEHVMCFSMWAEKQSNTHVADRFEFMLHVTIGGHFQKTDHLRHLEDATTARVGLLAVADAEVEVGAGGGRHQWDDNSRFFFVNDVRVLNGWLDGA